MDQAINTDYIYGGCYKLKDKVDYDVYDVRDNQVSTVVECKYANMYSEPDTSSEIIMQIPVGEQVKVIDDYPSAYSYYGQFNRIIYNDQDGYIENNYLMEDD